MTRLTVRAFAERLGRLPVVETMEAALEEASERLADGVRERLSHPPGDAHDAPWLRTGALHDSIGHGAEGLLATVGSTDPAAAFQEQGTLRVPPRPFLAPEAAAQGEALAGAIGRAVAAVLAGEEAGGMVSTDR